MTPAIVWTVSSALGLLRALLKAWDVRRDLRALQVQHQNGSAQITAREGVRDQLGRAAVFLLFFTIGVASLVHLPANPRTFGLVTIWCLIGGNVILTLNGELNARAGKRIVAEIVAEREQALAATPPDK